MTITVEATYENGTFKPAQPVALGEGAQVRLAITPVHEDGDTPPLNLAQWLASIEAQTGLVEAPEDWATQHDLFTVEETTHDHYRRSDL